MGSQLRQGAPALRPDPGARARALVDELRQLVADLRAAQVTVEQERAADPGKPARARGGELRSALRGVIDAPPPRRRGLSTLMGGHGEGRAPGQPPGQL